MDSGSITPGTEFSTPFETGCRATTAPDEFGAFLALDSDGVECQFSVRMVVEITRDPFTL